MNLNCRPGDLAVIVKTHPAEPATAQFIDRVVCVRAWEIRHGDPCWKYAHMPLRGKYRGMVVDWYEIPDEWLRPITPPPGTVTDSEVRELYEPQRETA